MKLRTALLCLWTCALGCTGLTLGERGPGRDTYLAGGAIAVDPRTETAFVLQQVTRGAPGADGGVRADVSPLEVIQTLYAIPPEGGGATRVADLTYTTDPRILFPEGGVMVMAETSTGDQLRRLDVQTFAETARVQTRARYNGTRMAPSRRYVAVADNATPLAPIHVIDATTLAVHVIPHGGWTLEAMWLNGSDTLVAIAFLEDAVVGPRARILSWPIEALTRASFPLGGDGFWATPSLDVTVPGAQIDELFSFTWVGVSPDDRYVVFPVLRHAPAPSTAVTHQLLVLTVATGAVRTVDDAYGPVGFSPDGSTVVSYRYTETRDPADGATIRTPHLLLVDANTLAVGDMPLPFTGGPQYFVTREGHTVVVTSRARDHGLILYDLQMGRMSTVTGSSAPVQLDEFVSRLGHHELWLIDRGLYRLDFMANALEPVALGWTPAHVNILPTRDRLVFDDAASGTIRFWDPATRAVTRSVTLPSPL